MSKDGVQGAPALKEIFDPARLGHFARETAAIWPAFDPAAFLARATEGLDDLGIMQRMRQTAVCLRATLPADFPTAVEILQELAPRIRHNFAAIALPEFVALYGQEHHDISMKALHRLTRFGSAEFAVRHFLARDFDRTLSRMRLWAADDDEHVRRLASEGSRPRLPWSFQLKNLLTDPSPTLPILERLRSDPSPYVRRSVANHLNDISKDNPRWLVDRLKAWPQHDAATAWIVRHALRTMIKRGDREALSLIGTTGTPLVRVEGFSVTPGEIPLGDRITIAGTLVSLSRETQRLVVDYAVHYVKKNGSASRKVFKLREADLAAGAREAFSIRQTIRDFTTRKHHAGFHRVELLLNGEIMAQAGFQLHIPA